MKKLVVLLVVSMMFVMCGNVWGGDKSDKGLITRLDSYSLHNDREYLSYLCVDGLSFVMSYKKGDSRSGVSVVQVLDTNGKPKTCKN